MSIVKNVETVRPSQAVRHIELEIPEDTAKAIAEVLDQEIDWYSVGLFEELAALHAALAAELPPA